MSRPLLPSQLDLPITNDSGVRPQLTSINKVRKKNKILNQILNYPQQIRQSSKDSTGSSDSDDDTSDDESLPNSTPNPPVSGTVQPPPEKAQKESEAGAEISALVNYVQPVHFSTFENAESKFEFLKNHIFNTNLLLQKKENATRCLRLTRNKPQPC